MVQEGVLQKRGRVSCNHKGRRVEGGRVGGWEGEGGGGREEGGRGGGGLTVS